MKFQSDLDFMLPIRVRTIFMSASEPVPPSLSVTPLHQWHIAQGGRMVGFAGYDMPVQYRAGILAEHLHVRAKSGLFDVSHMGQVELRANTHETVARALEMRVPADIAALSAGRQCYTQFLNDQGGIIDDLMVFRPASADGTLRLVVNAARKAVDLDLLRHTLRADIDITLLDRALLAVQGPDSANVLTPLLPGIEALTFMSGGEFTFADAKVWATRSGYTGEDGFEISLPSALAVTFANRLMLDPRLLPIGLGARDSLRLEAGLCLYGHELDETVSPVEARLTWSIGKRRRTEGGFAGFSQIRSELDLGPTRMRVGLLPMGRAPAREGSLIVDGCGHTIGSVTSGGFGPSVDGPVAMGYVPPSFAVTGTEVGVVVRGRALPARVVDLPFFPHRYQRG